MFKITAEEKQMILERRKVEGEVNDEGMAESLGEIMDDLGNTLRHTHIIAKGFKERKDKRFNEAGKHKDNIEKAFDFYSKIEDDFQK